MTHAMSHGLLLLSLMATALAIGCDPSGPRESPDTLTFKPLDQRQPGIGLVVALDVSGSMGGLTALADKRMVPKINVAREVTAAIVEQTAQWAQKHTDETIHLGVLTFADRVGVAAAMTRITAPGGPEQDAMVQQVNRVQASGSTAIGEAALAAVRLLAHQNMADNHLLLVTDGQNTAGPLPEAIAQLIAQLPPADRPSIYLIAFDVSEQNFANLRQYEWRVLPAADGAQLQRTIDEVVGGEILLEK